MKNNKIGMIGGVVALCAVIALVGVLYAVYTQTLQVNGTGTAEGARWDVHFAASEGESGVAKTAANSAGVTSTATGTDPSISPATTVGNFEVTLKTPGDYVEYSFDIVNGGSFDAELTTMPSLAIDYTKCSGNNPAGDDKATKDAADVLIVCGDGTNSHESKVTYTLTYADNTTAAQTGTAKTAGDSLAVNDELKAGQRVTVKLKVQYATQSGESAALPGNDVTLGIAGSSNGNGLGFSMVYTQI